MDHGLTKQDLIARARAEYGIRVTRRMIEWYERMGAIAKPRKVSGGYKKGVRGFYRPDDLRTVAALPFILRYSRRSLDHAIIGAWALHECPIPWGTVKGALLGLLEDARGALERSPDHAVRTILYGEIGKAFIPGRGITRQARADELYYAFRGEGEASIFLALAIGVLRSAAGDVSSDSPPFLRHLTIQDLLETVREAQEDDGDAVRPVLPWVLTFIFGLARFLHLGGLHHPSRRCILTFLYKWAPALTALALLLVRSTPTVWEEMVTGLKEVLQPYMPPHAADIIRDLPFQRRKTTEARAAQKR
jgi:hypothetical protein